MCILLFLLYKSCTLVVPFMPACTCLLYAFVFFILSLYVQFCTNPYANLFHLVCLSARCILYCTNSLRQFLLCCKFLLCCMFFFLCGEDSQISRLCFRPTLMLFLCIKISAHTKKKKKKSSFSFSMGTMLMERCHTHSNGYPHIE